MYSKKITGRTPHPPPPLKTENKTEQKRQKQNKPRFPGN